MQVILFHSLDFDILNIIQLHWLILDYFSFSMHPENFKKSLMLLGRIETKHRPGMG